MSDSYIFSFFTERGPSKIKIFCDRRAQWWVRRRVCETHKIIKNVAWDSRLLPLCNISFSWSMVRVQALRKSILFIMTFMYFKTSFFPYNCDFKNINYWKSQYSFLFLVVFCFVISFSFFFIIRRAMFIEWWLEIPKRLISISSEYKIKNVRKYFYLRIMY